MADNWPMTLRAARNLMEGGTSMSWALVDALATEIPDKECRQETWERVAAFLEANGVESQKTAEPYSAATIRDYRMRWAREFPPERRMPHVSFSAHVSAGTYANLEEILQELGTDRATTSQIREAMQVKTGQKAPVSETLARTLERNKRIQKAERAARNAINEYASLLDEDANQGVVRRIQTARDEFDKLLAKAQPRTGA